MSISEQSIAALEDGFAGQHIEREAAQEIHRLRQELAEAKSEAVLSLDFAHAERDLLQRQLAHTRLYAEDWKEVAKRLRGVEKERDEAQAKYHQSNGEIPCPILK